MRLERFKRFGQDLARGECFKAPHIPSPYPGLAPELRRCPSSLYTFPFPGLARDCCFRGGFPYTQFWTSDAPLDVRFWLLADIQRGSTERPALALKRTSRALVKTQPRHHYIGSPERAQDAVAGEDLA